MSPPPDAPIAARRKPAGPRLRTASIVVGAGFAIAVVSAIALLAPVFGTMFSRSYTVPGTVHVHLSTGKYVIYEQTGSKRRVGPITVTHNDAPTITVDDVDVSAPSGESVPVDYMRTMETITRGSKMFTGVVDFTNTEAGEYTITVRSSATEVIITRSIGDEFMSRIGFLFGGLVGGVTTATGFVLLVVGVVRRGRAQRVNTANAMWTPLQAFPAAGWHPDPWQPWRLRYWDGTRWTEHTQ